MHSSHTKNTIRYYILLIAVMVFLFFTNDFGLLDVQKTALILAAGIDKEGAEFIVTSQIAIPQESKQGKQGEAVQIVSRGKTVADAFEEINAKTGWYPKLVFCNLILLGESAAQTDVFDALEYFLRDEYFSEDCYVATCDGYAKDLLNTSALVDPSSSVAIGKVLSAHASRVGTVATTTLREFSIGYFGNSQSGFLPIVATQPQQEPTGSEKDASPPQSGEGTSSNPEQPSTSSAGDGTQTAAPDDKPVFSAKQTALFLRGKRVATLTADETFALNAVKNNLQLAPFTIQTETAFCSLTIKRNQPKLTLAVQKDGSASLNIRLVVTAGVLDYSQSLPVDEFADVGDAPSGIFATAEKKLTADICSVFEKSCQSGCDLFGIRDLLLKHKPKKLHVFQTTILQNTLPNVTVRFQNVR